MALMQNALGIWAINIRGLTLIEPNNEQVSSVNFYVLAGLTCLFI